MEESQDSFFGIREEEDVFILLHRQIHFGGKFSVMIEYYEAEGVGVHPEISIRRLYELQSLEQELDQNLAELFLVEEHYDIIQDSLHLYNQLKELYQSNAQEQELAVADLILSENEDPEEEIDRIVKCGEKALPLLIELIQNEKLKNSLYPGYGRAPVHAARCLGMIGSEKAIRPLFEMLGSFDSFDEQEAISALRNLGEKSCLFLLKILEGQPITEDNERAAYALTHFSEREEVGKTAAALLQRPEILAFPSFSQSLVLLTEKVRDKTLQNNLLALADSPKCPQEVKEEILFFSKQWR